MKNALRAHLDKQTYDKLYQDIECLGIRGYSGSAQSWKDIEYLGVNWFEKTVVDCGCFHAYFCFKVEKMGAARVIGLEPWDDVLATANRIKQCMGSKVELVKWHSDDPIPECDIILCLNALHHFPNKDKTLSNMNCQQAIFEINAEDSALVGRYFDVDQEELSHRKGRIFLKCTRRKEATTRLNLEKHTESKIFVTGVHGSGKTSYAKEYATRYGLKFINFDTNFDYTKASSLEVGIAQEAELQIMGLLSDNYVIDAVPFCNNLPYQQNAFHIYARKNDIRIVCCVCSSKQTWEDRVRDRKHLSAVGAKQWHEFAHLYYTILPRYNDLKVSYFDTATNEYISKDEMFKRIEWVKPLARVT